MKYPKTNCNQHDQCEMTITEREFRDGSTHLEMRCSKHNRWIKWLSQRDYEQIKNSDLDRMVESETLRSHKGA